MAVGAHRCWGPLRAAYPRAAQPWSSPLEALDLNNNHLGDDGAAELARGLACNRTLLQLSLWSNGVGVRGAGALDAALRANAERALTHLNLQDGGTNANSVPGAVQRRLKLALAPRPPASDGPLLQDAGTDVAALFAA